jgi:beta-galactosidase
MQERIDTSKDVTGGLSWCAFDYNSNMSVPGWSPPEAAHAVMMMGVCDAFRIPKFHGYFLQSQRDPSVYGPMVFIASYWEQASDANNVVVCTNCDSVRLYINGALSNVKAGKYSPGLAHPLLHFDNLTWQSGELKAVGYYGGKIATHIRNTPGPAVKLALTPDTSALQTGGDMCQVTVTALDSKNQIVPRASNTVTLSATGAGVFLGKSPINLEDGKMCFFVQTLDSATGAINCQASSQGLTGASAVIAVNPLVSNSRAALRPAPDRIISRTWHAMAVNGRIDLPSWVLKKSRVSLYTISGKLLYKNTVSTRMLDLKKAVVSKGVYLVRVDSMEEIR